MSSFENMSFFGHFLTFYVVCCLKIIWLNGWFWNGMLSRISSGFKISSLQTTDWIFCCQEPPINWFIVGYNHLPSHTMKSVYYKTVSKISIFRSIFDGVLRFTLCCLHFIRFKIISNANLSTLMNCVQSCQAEQNKVHHVKRHYTLAGNLC